MFDAETLLDIIQKMARKETKRNAVKFVFGIVTSVDPLKIRIGSGDGDGNSYEIDEDYLVLSPFCKRTVLGIPSCDNPEHLHEIDAKTEKATTGIIVTCAAGSVVEDAGHTHDIKIKTELALPQMLLWRGLKKDDKVMILRISGSLYWVLQRFENIENPANVDDDGAVQENEEEVS